MRILIPAYGIRKQVRVSNREPGSCRGNEQMAGIVLSLLLLSWDNTDVLVPGKPERKRQEERVKNKIRELLVSDLLIR